MAKKTYLYQINITRDCNLRCTHCYIHSDVKKMSQQMSVPMFLKTIGDLVEHMENINYDHAEIHIIGGEPTMLGKDWFSQAMPKARQILQKSSGFTWELIMVSNLLTRELSDIYPWFDRIATSYEPETRFPKKKLEEWWLINVKYLQDQDVDIQVTTAITKDVIRFGAQNLLQKYLDMGIKKVHFGFMIPSGDGKDNIEDVFPEFHETSSFLIDAAKWYFSNRIEHEDMYVNPCESLLNAIHTDEPLDDIVCPIIAGSIDIDWNGNAVTCIEEGGNKDTTWLGNIFHTSILQVTNSGKFKKEVMKAARPKRECQSCEEYRICRSGCGKLFEYWNPETNEDCPGFKKFIKFSRASYEAGELPKIVT